MSKKFLSLLLAVSLGVNLGVVAMTLMQNSAKHPQGPHRGPGGDRAPEQRPDPEQIVQRHLQGMTRHLELDAEQQQAIRAILEQHVPEQSRLQFEVAEDSRQMLEAFSADDFDPERFRQLMTAAAVARAELDSVSTVMLLAEAAVLTAEQRQKFAAVAPAIRSAPQGPPPEEAPPPEGRGRPEGGPPPPR